MGFRVLRASDGLGTGKPKFCIASYCLLKSYHRWKEGFELGLPDPRGYGKRVLGFGTFGFLAVQDVALSV